MSLARGEDRRGTTRFDGQPVDRGRGHARRNGSGSRALVGQDVTVMMVASREEAVALLLGNDPPPAAPGRRAGGGPTPGDEHRLTVDSDLRTASYQGVSVPLSPLEHDLLRCLVREAGRTWPFEILHREIWGTGHLGGLADVQSVVKRLRRKLRDLRCPVGSARSVGSGCGWTGGWRRPPRSVAQRLIARCSQTEVGCMPTFS